MWCQQKQSVTDGQMIDKVIYISMWRFVSLAPQLQPPVSDGRMTKHN